MKLKLNRIVNLLLLLMAVLSTLSLLTESIGSTARGNVAAWTAAVCLCVWVAASFRRGILLGMPAAGLLLYAAYRRFGEDLAGQLGDLLDQIGGAYYTQIYAPGSEFLYDRATEDQTMVLLLVGFLLAAFLASALTLRSGRIFITLLGTLPILGFCIAVNAAPSAFPTVCITAFWALLLISGDRWEPDSTSGRAVILSVLPVALVLLALLALRPPASYSYTEKDLAMSRSVDEFLSRIADTFSTRQEQLVPSFAETLPVTAESSEEAGMTALPAFALSWQQEDTLALTEPYDRLSAALPVFRYTAERDGRLYFRTRSYGDYTGSGWSPAEEPPGMSSLNFTAEAAAEGHSAAYSLRLEMLTACDDLPLPYFTVREEAGDSGAQSAASGTLTLRCYAASFAELSLPRGLRAQEEAYRVYAQEVYTRLPEETREAVLAFCALRGLTADDPALIETIAETVRSHVSYDLDAVYPDGDVVSYFLTRADGGYCIHYASAAAAICRALGIPARVTVGFVSEARAGAAVTVSGADAHAWVEIYREGLGWLPLEVTGQSASAASETGESTAESPETETQAQMQSEADVPTASPSPPPAPTPGAQTLPVGWVEEAEAPSSLPSWAILLIAAAIFAALFFLRYALLRRVMKRRISQADNGKAVIAMYRSAKKAVGSENAIPDTLRMAAEKAVFSRRGVTAEERAAAGDALDALLREQLQSRSPFGAFVFRYWQGLA